MNKVTTTRRTLQQIKHCVEEALAVVENKEDVLSAIDDLEQAKVLTGLVLEELRKQISSVRKKGG